MPAPNRQVGTGPKPGELGPDIPHLGKLVQLEHGAPGGALASLEAAIGFDADVPDVALRDAILAKLSGSATKITWAVIDLSGKKVRFAGNQATTPRSPGSMGKLAIMLAAYQLRHDLRALARAGPIGTFAALTLAAAKRWTDAQVRNAARRKELRASSPSIAREGDVVLIDGKEVPIPKYARVALDRIFDAKAFDAGQPLDFARDGLTFHQLFYVEYRDKKDQGSRDTWGRRIEKALKVKPGAVVRTTDVTKLGFAERMALLIGFSSNTAPDSLVKDLGFGLVHSPLLASGLFHPARGGLWLGHTYGPTKFAPPPLEAVDLPGRESVGISGTAAATATLVAAIALGKVCDQAACDEMMRLLDKRKAPHIDRDAGMSEDDLKKKWVGHSIFQDPRANDIANPGAGTDSFIKDFLVDHGVEGVVAHSKLGIVTPRSTKVNHESDTALVGRPGKTPHAYVLSVLDVPAGQRGDFAQVVAAVHDAITGRA